MQKYKQGEQAWQLLIKASPIVSSPVNFPEDDARKIIEYDNAWGGIGYGVIFGEEDPNRYRETEFVRNPRVYWEKSA